MRFQIDNFIVCGDSFSEGMTDIQVNGKYKGWADRVADVLATQSHGFKYANLAVRGKLIPQVVTDQVPAAINLVKNAGPNTLVSFHAGANDVIRPKYVPEITLPAYAKAVRDLAAELKKHGAHLMLFTVQESVDTRTRTGEIWNQRFKDFNNQVRSLAAEVGAVLNEANNGKYPNDIRLLAFDRLHLNADGHNRVAQGVLENLEAPFDPDYILPLPPAKPTPFIKAKALDAAWIATFVIPWIIRRLRGKSSGDNRVAKYPSLISWPISPISNNR
jgi:lysophospholipase L1-like esterase